MPGQVGLNAGILPSPGFTYVNMDINYDAGSFNDRNGNAVPVTGNYNVWVVENIFYLRAEHEIPRRKSGIYGHIPNTSERLPGCRFSEIP
jgi:hypothetical protein